MLKLGEQPYIVLGFSLGGTLRLPPQHANEQILINSLRNIEKEMDHWAKEKRCG